MHSIMCKKLLHCQTAPVFKFQLLKLPTSSASLANLHNPSKFQFQVSSRVEVTAVQQPPSPPSDPPLLTPPEIISLTGVQRTLLSVGAATAALLNPARHDMVATLGETTGYRALVNIHRKMVGDEEGRRILKERPRINSAIVDLASLQEMPEGTLGWCYTKFLDDNRVTPDSRAAVQFVVDEELRYVMQRYREVHDLFHSVLGMPTNMLGEVAVKWVEAMQTGLPMCAGAALFGPLRFRPKQRAKYVQQYLPWAIKVGQESKPLMNVYYEERWEQPVEDLRKELNITPFPYA